MVGVAETALARTVWAYGSDQLMPMRQKATFNFLMGIVIGCLLTVSAPAVAKTWDPSYINRVANELAQIKRDVSSATRAQWAQVYWMKRQARALEARAN